MKQKYPTEEVIAPGTVIMAAGNCIDIQKSGTSTPKRRWLNLLHQSITR
jgi:hypothetical protein